MNTVIVFSMALIFLILPVSVVQARAVQCHAAIIPFDQMRSGLLEKWGERPNHLGELGGDSFTVLFTNKMAKSYSIVYVDREGLSCIILYGLNWHYNPEPEEKMNGEKS